jgi:hypothetical protein
MNQLTVTSSISSPTIDLINIYINDKAYKYYFETYTDPSGNSFSMGNEIDGGYITAKDINFHEEEGVCMNELVPQLYYKNLYDVNPYRILFEIYNDGAYISHTLTGTNWIKLAEENT